MGPVLFFSELEKVKVKCEASTAEGSQLEKENGQLRQKCER